MLPLSFIQILFLVKRKDALSLLSRFVVDKEGRRIGESISVYKDLLIIKKNGKFYAIPLKHVEVRKEELYIKGVVQWDVAEKLAREWRKNV
ncbi:MAG: hypothetical protein FE048_03235 [Thermoplasmata archaeon]|nr:MAG: hypothetical protein FE048_03235 [Thermoplasmata archaeon]